MGSLVSSWSVVSVGVPGMMKTRNDVATITKDVNHIVIVQAPTWHDLVANRANRLAVITPNTFNDRSIHGNRNSSVMRPQGSYEPVMKIPTAIALAFEILAITYLSNQTLRRMMG